MLIDYAFAPEAPTFRNNLSFTAASSAAKDAGVCGQNRGVLVVTPTQNCYIRFGGSDVTAATSSDLRLVAGKLYCFEFNAATRYFRVIRQSADGILTWYVSGAVLNPLSDANLVPDVGVTPLVLWDSRAAGASASVVVDLIRGLALTATATTFAADSTNFGGKSVWQMDGLTGKLENLAIDPVIFAASSLPHWWYVARMRTDPGAQQTLWYASDGSSVYRNSGASAIAYFVDSANASASNTGNATHVGEAFLTAAGVATMGINGTDTTNGTGKVSGPISALTIGDTPQAVGDNPSTMSLLAFGCYAATLTAQQRLELRGFYANQGVL